MTRYQAILAAVVASTCLWSALSYDQRPAYHVTPELGQWMNDPNGPMHFNGYYHLFFQNNPYGTVWGNMSWAHVISQDLVHWERLPVAMYNDKDFDIGGVFSGSAAIQNGTPFLFYTCVNAEGVQLQCVARPQDVKNATLEDWFKYRSNPIIPTMPAGGDGINFRDPTVWDLSQEKSAWSMITAATNGHEDPSSAGNGIVALYSTTNEKFPFGWSYSNALWSSDNPTAGFHTWMVECPDFFSGEPSAEFQRDAGDKYVLKYSIMETWQEFYEVGAYAANKCAASNATTDVTTDVTTDATSDATANRAASTFVRDTSYVYPYQTTSLAPTAQFPGLLLDYGPNGSFYASKTFYDGPNSQRLLWGWSKEADGNVADRDWQGVQSLPRAVALDEEQKVLRVRPAPQLKALRSGVVYQAKAEAGTVGGVLKLETMRAAGVRGLQLEVLASFAGTSGCSLEDLKGWEFGVKARANEAFASFTTYGFAIASASTANTTAVVHGVLDSSLSGGTTPVQVVRTPLPTAARMVNGQMKFGMQLFLDHSMTELFLEDGALAATMRIYPAEEQQQLAWFVTGPATSGGGACEVVLDNIVVYSMGSIWKA